MWRIVILLLIAGLSACQSGPQTPPTARATAAPSAVLASEALILIDQNGRDALAALDMGSGEAWVLIDNFERTSGPGFRSLPALSPDRKKLAFTPRRTVTTGNTSEVVSDGIWVMGIDGRGTQQIVQRPESDEYDDPQWSPDGTQIAFEQDGAFGGVFVVAARGGEITELIPGDLQPSGMRWSPDGTRAAYHSRRTTTGADSQSGLYIYDFETGTETLVVTEPDVNYADIDWSPDGTMIAYVRSAFRDNLMEVYVVNADGSDARNLTPGQAYAYDPQFSPDGIQLAYNHYDSTAKTYAVHLLMLDGSEDARTLLSLPGNRSGPAW